LDHSENTFDGSGVKRLLSNKFELDKVYIVDTSYFTHSKSIADFSLDKFLVFVDINSIKGLLKFCMMLSLCNSYGRSIGFAICNNNYIGLV